MMKWKFWEEEEEEKPTEKKEPEFQTTRITPKPLTKELMKEIAAKKAQEIKAKAEKTGIWSEVIELQEQVANLQNQLKWTREAREKQDQQIRWIKQDMEALGQKISQLEADQKNTEIVLENLAKALNELLNKERPEASQAAQDVVDQINQLWNKIEELEKKVDSLSK